MAMVIKMVGFIFIMNMFLYLGINLITGLPDSNGNVNYLNNNLAFHFDNDLLQQWMGSRVQLDSMINNSKLNYTTYNVNMSGTIVVQPQKVGGGINGLTSFIDVVDTVWSFITMLFNIALAPLTLFFSYNLPPMIGLMVGIPWAIIYILGIIWFIRGMPS